MVKPNEDQGNKSPVHSLRLSSVGTSRATKPATIHELTGLDLALKLHYLKAVYIFSAEATREITVPQIKEAMFSLLNHIFWTTGRFRRHDSSGRPYIKCNDCGSRFVEGDCDRTVEEWLSEPDRSRDEDLVYHQPVGPELAFSPLIYVQITRFKCGGMSLGLSWAHVLGDPSSLSHALNLWVHIFSGHNIAVPIPRPSNQPRGFQDPNPNPTKKEPASLKRADPVGDLWVTPNNRIMATYSFNMTASEVSSHFPANSGDQNPVFETVSGIIWKCIARVREQSEPRTVTIVRKDTKEMKPKTLSNSRQIISSVHVDFPVADANLEALVRSISEATDERTEIDEIVESDNGVSDFVVYGAKLTFVDLSGVDFYEVRLKGKSPESVYCNVQGIGDQGAVVVLPVAKEEGAVVTLTVTLPEEEVERVKSELKNLWIV